MEIRDLGSTPLRSVVDCLLRAFEGYFVAMPKELHVWEQRFGRSGVDWSRSYGVFMQEELVAFIIHAMGEVDGRRTAFNTGTGVVPEQRGKHLVDALYAHALPELKQAGTSQCALEVITKNVAAVRVYERVGFTAAFTWKCFLGEPVAHVEGEPLQPCDPQDIRADDDHWYSWDHKWDALQRNMGGFVAYTLGRTDPWGHVIMDPDTGRMARLGVREENDREQWVRMMASLASLRKPLRLVNVHPARTALIDTLLHSGLVNDIDQFEMRMEL